MERTRTSFITFIMRIFFDKLASWGSILTDTNMRFLEQRNRMCVIALRHCKYTLGCFLTERIVSKLQQSGFCGRLSLDKMLLGE
jgi:hypothetical protein